MPVLTMDEFQSTSGIELHASSLPFDLLHRALDIRDRDAREEQSYAILSMSQKHIIRTIAATTSCVSITASLLAVYWFVNMRRNFRRDLILLLIIGEFFKNLWFLVFSAYSFVQADLVTGTSICLANGYLLQASVEMCDLAILFMSLHMSLQIFPPSHSFLGDDGLYRIRKWVIAAWIIIPNILAALAFINKGRAYEAAGPFCTLPIRPFWPRLALSWVPRYFIWLYIMWIAICIYRHVGKEFQVFGQVKSGSSTSAGTFSSPEDSAVTGTSTTYSFKAAEREEKGVHDSDDVGPHFITPQTETFSLPGANEEPRMLSAADNRSDSKLSGPDWSQSFPFGSTHPINQTSSAPGSRRGSQQIAEGVTAEDFAPLSSHEFGRRRSSLPTLPREPVEHLGLDSISEGNQSESSESTAEGTANEMIQSRRRAMQRQLRLLFIYPVVYILIWFIPFITHCLNYSNRYARHPVFPMTALNTFCLTFLGTADACIFCWRERPWRHIPGSDGTFVGSFKFWKFVRGNEWSENLRRQSRRPSQLGPLIKKPKKSQGLKKSLKRLSATFRLAEKAPSVGTTPLQTPKKSSGPPPVSMLRAPQMHKRTRTGGSDSQRLEVQRAHQRLALERLDYEQRARSHPRESIVSLTQALNRQTPPSKKRKEWWDRAGKDQHLFDDNDEQSPTEATRRGSNDIIDPAETR